MRQLKYCGLPWDGSAAQKCDLTYYSEVLSNVEALGLSVYFEWQDCETDETFQDWLISSGHTALEVVLYSAYASGFDDCQEISNGVAPYKEETI